MTHIEIGNLRQDEGLNGSSTVNAATRRPLTAPKRSRGGAFAQRDVDSAAVHALAEDMALSIEALRIDEHATV